MKYIFIINFYRIEANLFTAARSLSTKRAIPEKIQTAGREGGKRKNNVEFPEVFVFGLEFPRVLAQTSGISSDSAFFCLEFLGVK